MGQKYLLLFIRIKSTILASFTAQFITTTKIDRKIIIVKNDLNVNALDQLPVA